MGFLRKKDDPYEVPEEVAGSRSEIDDFRARMRQQVGGEQAQDNPELAKLKEAYGNRLTDHLGSRTGDKEPRGETTDFGDLLGGGSSQGSGSFASPEDSGPSGFVPGLDDETPTKTTRRRAKKPSGSGGAFACNDCGTSFKESWSKCPKCGGKVEKTELDPEVEKLRAASENEGGSMRTVDTSSDLGSLLGGPTTEFGREDDSRGLREVDDLLTDFSDPSPQAPGSPTPVGAGEGFQCKTCKTEYKEKWGKCPKCGGEVERARAPAEINRLEEQHRDLESSGNSSSSSGGGSGMLGELMGGTTTPAPLPERASNGRGLPELEDLIPDGDPGGSRGKEMKQASQGEHSPDTEEFKPSTEPGPPALDDLTQDLALPDEEAAESPSQGDTDAPPASPEEPDLTPEEVGIRQAEMTTDFSFARPGQGPRKVRKARKGGPRETSSRRGPPARPPRGPKVDAKPDPFARPPRRPADLMAGRKQDIPRPEALDSPVLDLLRKPSDKKRQT